MDVLPAAKIGEIVSGGHPELSYHTYLPWFSEILLSGDAMDVLPATKIAEIASGVQPELSYLAYQPRISR